MSHIKNLASNVLHDGQQRAERLKQVFESSAGEDLRAVIVDVTNEFLERILNGEDGARYGIMALRHFLNKIGDDIKIGESMRTELIRRTTTVKEPSHDAA